MHPNLGLHSAAATGNIGLVKFALDNGQPHTSILNGLLPLHAACSGGSEAVVRLLLSYGADVNTIRIKTSKGLGMGSGTGTEGSTPLHFAAANGHVAIIRLLLENGARPTTKDKDGLTPEALASLQNHSACVMLLQSWISAYGPNGLAGPLPGTYSKAVTASPASLDLQSNSSQSTTSPLRNQRSFEHITSAAAGVKASIRNHKRHALAKVSSDPNLKASASNPSFLTPPSPPPPLPTPKSEYDPSTTNTSSNSSQTVTSSGLPNLLNRESKRRPSLPSIFERAAHSSHSLRTALTIHPPTIYNDPADSIEELSFDGKESKSKTSNLSPPSPSRMTHRLTGKRSLTGLLRKTTGTTQEGISSYHSNSSSNDPLSPTRSNIRLPEVSATSTSSEGMPKNDAGTPSTGSRGLFTSTEMNTQPTFLHLTQHDVGSQSSQSSPASSMENVDATAKYNSPPQYPFRPRKSSNLSTTNSPLFSQSQLEEMPTTTKTLSPVIYPSKLSVEHGRKRSQSTTSVPKRPNPQSDKEANGQLSYSQQGFQQSNSRQSQDNIHDNTQEFLVSAVPASKERSNNQQTRFRELSSTNNRSPLLPTKSLVEDTGSGPSYFSGHPSSPLFTTRQLHSRESNSSLVSSTSSSNTNFNKQSRSTPRSAVGGTPYGTPDEDVSTGASQVDATTSNRSPSHSESLVNKASNSSMRSFGIGLTAQEQAQAILRSAEGGGATISADGSTLSLTQMLAAYGEALAQERKGNSQGNQISANIRKQASLASLASNSRSHQLPSVNELTQSPSNLNTEPQSNSSVRINYQGSLTPYSTPPDSPQTTRSRAESSATSFSRSQSSHRQNAPPRGLAEFITGEFFKG